MTTDEGWIYRVTYPRSKRDYGGPRSTMTFTDYEEAVGFVEHLGVWISGAPVVFERRRLLYSDWEAAPL